MTLKVAQIGAGWFSRMVHGPVLYRLANCEVPIVSLEGICDLDGERPERARVFQKDFGYRESFTDFRRMIDAVDPDILVCIVHPTKTLEVLEGLLPRRLPLFTEKPPGRNLAEATRAAVLSMHHKADTYVAFNRRRIPSIEFAKKWAAEHGPVRYIRAEMLRNRRYEQRFGLLTAIHVLDTLRYFAGEAAEIQVCRVPYKEKGMSDYLARLVFHSGVIADLAVVLDAGITRETYVLQAENAQVQITLSAGYSNTSCWAGVRAYRDDRLEYEQAADPDRLVAGGFLQEHHCFLNAVLGGIKADCSLEDAEHSMRLASALESGYSGTVQSFVEKEDF